jgi:hypothetical protein
MIEALISMCRRLNGRRGARKRALRAVTATKQAEPGPPVCVQLGSGPGEGRPRRASDRSGPRVSGLGLEVTAVGVEPGQRHGGTVVATNSKECYSSVLADLVQALSNWSDSKDGKRHGWRVGFPRFKCGRRPGWTAGA